MLLHCIYLFESYSFIAVNSNVNPLKCQIVICLYTTNDLQVSFGLEICFAIMYQYIADGQKGLQCSAVINNAVCPF